MTVQINTPPVLVPPTVCDFGWWYGAGQEYTEFAYTVANNSYPLGATVTAGSSVTLPQGTIQVGSTSSFETTGIIMLGALGGGSVPVPVAYTGKTSTTFTGCTTTGTGTFPVGTVVFDNRFYTNDALLGQTITFDAVDSIPLGLPKVQVPTGVYIKSYQWDFGNGATGFGPTASTVYNYQNRLPGIQVSLLVTDSLNRSFSCARQINLISVSSPYFGIGYQVRSGSARS